MHTISEFSEWNKSRVHGIYYISDIFSVYHEDFPTQAWQKSRVGTGLMKNNEQICTEVIHFENLFSY